MVEVKNLVKNYGKLIALNNVSFTVNKGDVLGFLGPNGAGKSTTLNIITGYISSSSGDVFVDGVDILKEPLKAREKIGYLPEVPPLYLDMTVSSYLKFVCSLKKIQRVNSLKAINYVCKKVNILNIQNRLIRNLSKGYRQRLGLAGALLGNPPVLILDEPSVGLDPRQVVEMRELIKNLGRDHTIILSSHILSEIQEICSRIIIINNGQIIANDSTENLLCALSKNEKLLVQVEGEREKVRSVLKNVEGVIKISTGKKKKVDIYEYIVDTNKDTIDLRRSIFNSLVMNSFVILNLSGVKSSSKLEDVFLNLTVNDSSVNNEYARPQSNKISGNSCYYSELGANFK